MMSQTLGNVCLGLALLVFLLPLQFVAFPAPTRGENAMGQAFGLLLILLPLWIFLGGALLATDGAGGLDWLSPYRGWRITAIVLSCLAMLVVSFLAGLLHNEPASQIPWAARPFIPWAIEVCPIIVMAFSLIALNSFAPVIPPLVLRVPLVAICGLALLSCFGMLGEWFVSAQNQEMARVDTIVSNQQKRTQDQIDSIATLDAETDLVTLLGLTNRFHDPKVRELALAKLRTNPNLEQRLAERLRDGDQYALIFLDASEPPERQPLAEPLRAAILVRAENVRELIRSESTLHADDFDFDARLILSGVEKLRGLGVQFAPAIRAFRAALDEPRRDKPKANCASTLDQWLAKNPNF